MVFRVKPDITTGIFGRGLFGTDFDPTFGAVSFDPTSDIENQIARDETQANALRQALFLPSKADISQQEAVTPTFAAADPTSLPDENAQQRQATIFSTPIADLRAASNIALRFPEMFPSDIAQQLRQEADIKEELGFLKTMSSQDQAELIFKNQAGDLFGVQSFLSRKGLDLIDAFPGQRDIQIKASERLAQEFQAAFPGLEEATLIEKGAFRAGKLSRAVIEVTLTANALGITSKAGQAALKTLPQGARAAVAGGIILGGTELLQAPREGETIGGRTVSVIGATVFGAAAGKVVDFVLSPIVKGVQRLSDKAFVNRNPQFKNFSESAIRRMRADKDIIQNINKRAGFGEDVRVETVDFIKSEGEFLSDLQSTLSARAARFGLKRGPTVTPQRVTVPRGFRAGKALVPQEPIKAAGKAAKVAKDPLVFGGLKTGLEKITVQGTKDLPFGIGKVSPRRFVEISTTDVKFLKNRLAQEARVSKEAFVAGKKVEKEVTAEVRAKRDIALTEAKAKRIMQVTELRATTKITEATRKEARQIAKDLLPSGKERDKFFTAIKNSKKPEDLVEFYDAVEQRFEALEKSDAIDRVTKINKKIEDTLKKQKKGKVSKKNVIRPEAEDQFRVISDKFSAAKLSDKKLEAAEEVLKLMDETKESIVDPLTGKFDETLAELKIPKAQRELLEQATKKDIREMSTDELNTIAESLENLLFVNSTVNEILLGRKGADLKQTLTNINDDVASTKPLRKQFGIKKIKSGLFIGKKLEEIPFNLIAEREAKRPIQNLVDFTVGELSFDVKTLASKMVGDKFGDSTQVFEMNFIKDRSAQAGFRLDTYDRIGSDMAKNNVTLNDLAKWTPIGQRVLRSKVGQAFKGVLSKVTGGKISPAIKLTVEATSKETGKTVKINMNPSELMSIGMHSRSTGGLNVLFNRGLISRNFATVTFTPEQLKKALSGLLDRQKGWMDDTAITIKDSHAAAIDDISVRNDGFKKATEEDYWPEPVVKEQKLSGTGLVPINFIDKPGFLKTRVPNNNPVELVGFVENLISMTEGVGILHMTDSIRAARTVINNPTLTDTMNKQGFFQTRKRLIILLDKVQTKRIDDNTLAKIFSFIEKGKVPAVLADVGISLGQWTSVNGYMTEVDAQFRVTALTPPKPGSIKRHMANIPSFRQRVEGMMSSDAVVDVTRSNVAKPLTGKTDVGALGLVPLHKIDAAAVDNAYSLAEAEIGAKTLEPGGLSARYWNFVGGREKLKPNTPEFWEAVSQRGDFLVGRTQPNWQPEHKDNLTSLPRPASSFFKFRSYVSQIPRMQAKANQALSNGIISKELWAQKTSAIWTGAASNAVLRAGVRGVVFGAKVTVAGLVASMIAAPFKIVPIIGFFLGSLITDAEKRISGEGKVDTREVDIDIIPLQVAESFLTSGKNMSDALLLWSTGEKEKGDKKMAEAIKRLAVELSEVFLKIPARDIREFTEKRILPEEPKKKKAGKGAVFGSKGSDTFGTKGKKTFGKEGKKTF